MIELQCESIKWNKFNDNYRECMNVGTVTRNLSEVFIKDISVSNVLVLIHHGDAVKNIANDQIEADRIYSVLSDTFKLSSYAEKVRMMKHMPKDIDFRLWSRQQWPVNTINYALLNNIKLIYIQADYNYCRYPSMFAEAMCNVLYNKYYRIDDAYYYATSTEQSQSLYNVGNYDVANKLKQIAAMLNVPVIEDIPGDVEWSSMTESYLNSLYDNLLTTKLTTDSYIFYPWKIIYDNWPTEIEPIMVTVSSLSQGSKQIQGMYIRDLQLGNRDIIIARRTKFLPSWKNIPISILGNKISVILRLGVGPNLFIEPDIIFDGTFDNPRIYIDGNMLNIAHVNFIVNGNHI